jgi:hypothetical protein
MLRANITTTVINEAIASVVALFGFYGFFET